MKKEIGNYNFLMIKKNKSKIKIKYIFKNLYLPLYSSDLWQIKNIWGIMSSNLNQKNINNQIKLTDKIERIRNKID